MQQKDLAVALGIAVSTLQTWESGEHQIKAENLRDICRILRITPSAILGLIPSALEREVVGKAAYYLDRLAIKKVLAARRLDDLGSVLRISALVAAQVPATWVPVSKSEYEEEMAKIVMHVQSLGLFDKTEKKWLRWLQDLGFGSVEE